MISSVEPQLSAIRFSANICELADVIRGKSSGVFLRWNQAKHLFFETIVLHAKENFSILSIVRHLNFRQHSRIVNVIGWNSSSRSLTEN